MVFLILIDILILAVTILGLWFGASWVVDSASKIAKQFGLSDLVIGLTIVAIATSSPEFAVTISAALRDQHAISVGNVIGSNIFNLGIILGLISIFSPVKISKSLLFRDGSLLVGTGFLLLIFFYDLVLSQVEGIILFIILVAYIIILIKQKQDIEEEIPEDNFKFWDVPIFILGVATIIISANYLVDSASNIARYFGISEWLIGITIVAGGTSMPEFATSVVALHKRKHGISAGNLIGSDLFNMLGVLGIAALLKPLSLESSEFLSLVLLSITLVIIFIMMRTGWKISKIEGILLIAIAIFRWGYDFIF
ncbi:MAG: calcium/sodium antiporter [Ignavibacteriales bacterium]|nr:calcium/sodium antiporter [Ignavibacteriales bacterium]